MSTGAYTTESIRSITAREHVRQRPGMYVGDRAVNGIHHLIEELLQNSLREWRVGAARTIECTLYEDGFCKVEDDGRGIPVHHVPELGVSALEAAFTTFRSRRIAGIGAKAVCFLTEVCHVNTCRDGCRWELGFHQGIPVSGLLPCGESKAQGTSITFRPDPEIFGDHQVDRARLVKRLQELALLYPGLQVSFCAGSDQQTFEYHDGIAQYVRELNREADAVHEDVPSIRAGMPENQFELAFQFRSDRDGEQIQSFVNTHETIMGGTHVNGFRRGLRKALKDYWQQQIVVRQIPSGRELAQSLTAVVSVQSETPEFGGATRAHYIEESMGKLISNTTARLVCDYFQKHPDTAAAIVRQACL